ncbi:hypothetical protein B484DRAFT_415228 [Ochromonadaceae sp. CCMP2298]|nr:hypothetical protein B484DRAFT_415228 [Ochromonadaceae sp. CCMP2298]
MSHFLPDSAPCSSYGAQTGQNQEGSDSGSLDRSSNPLVEPQDSGNGFLRSPVSSPGRDVSRSNISEGRIEHSNSSVSSTGSRARRSVEQFDQEGGLGDGDSFDDAPMLASINSAEFRRTTDPARDPARGYGIVHSSDVAAASAGVDSLLYSPSVSTASTCSRYSVEDDGSDNEEGAAGGQGDKSWTQKSRPTSAMDDQSPFRTDSKSAGRGGGGEFGRKALGDSVDSAKMEFQSRVARRSFKPDSDRESADRLRDVGDRTLISSIPTTAREICSSARTKGRKEFFGAARCGDTRTSTSGMLRAMDFAHDDEGSINSLALSDSNNIDDL